MSNLKSIKVEEPVYHDLDDFRAKHETFSEVVGRLLKIAHALLSIQSTASGAQEYADHLKKLIHDETVQEP